MEEDLHDKDILLHALVGMPPTSVVTEVPKHPISPETPQGEVPSAEAESPDHYRSDAMGHAKHLVQCLTDAYGLEYTKGAVWKLAARFRLLDLTYSLDKTLKWFYGQGLSICVGENPTLSPHPKIKSGWKGCIRGVLGTGKLGRFLLAKVYRARRRYLYSNEADRAKALSLGQTLLMLKKGTPVVPSSLQDEAREKHRRALSDPFSGLHSRDKDPQIQEDIDLDDAIVRSIRRTVEELFRGKNHKFQQGGGIAPFPSLSSHFSSNRDQGGAASKLCEAWRQAKFNEYGIARPLQSENLYLSLTDQNLSVVHFEGQEERFWTWVQTQISIEEEDGYPAVPIQILEPLKVRTVTAGPEVSYWLCTWAQKWMWSVLKQHPTFALIGKTIDAESLNENLLKTLPGKRKFSSGDYSGATDNLRRFISQEIWRQVAHYGDVPEWYSLLVENCLVNHTLYSERPRPGVAPDPWKQGNGQLMGSPVSFPILCIANAVLCRMSFDSSGHLHQKEVPLKDLPLLINGDDCVSLFSEEENLRWQGLAKKFGMEPSPGKCYFHSQFLQMNSELFAYSYTPDIGSNGSFSRIPFWNFSLVKDRSSKGDQARSYLSLGPLSHDFTRGVLKDTHVGEARAKIVSRSHAIFRHRQRGLLAKVPPGCSWNLPTHLGGIGLSVTEKELHIRTTPEQLKIASSLYNELLLGKKRTLFPPGDFLCHPWMTDALESVSSHFEEVDVEFDSSNRNDISWADLSGDDETFFSQQAKMDYYSPMLWREANRRSFRSSKKEERERLKKIQDGDNTIDFSDFAMHYRETCASKSFFRYKKSVGEALSSLHDCLRPLKITRRTCEVDISQLRNFVPAPRNMVSVLAPYRLADYVVPTGALIANDFVRAFGVDVFGEVGTLFE